jgi:hypothetical protein
MSTWRAAAANGGVLRVPGLGRGRGDYGWWPPSIALTASLDGAVDHREVRPRNGALAGARGRGRAGRLQCRGGDLIPVGDGVRARRRGYRAQASTAKQPSKARCARLARMTNPPRPSESGPSAKAGRSSLWAQGSVIASDHGDAPAGRVSCRPPAVRFFAFTTPEPTGAVVARGDGVSARRSAGIVRELLSRLWDSAMLQSSQPFADAQVLGLALERVDDLLPRLITTLGR